MKDYNPETISENNKINFDSENLLLYVQINHNDKKIRDSHLEFVSMMLANQGWTIGGDIKLKDFSGNVSEFTILKGRLKE